MKILHFAQILFILGLLACKPAVAASQSEPWYLAQQIKVTVTSAGSTKVLNQNPYRQYLLIQNNGAATVSLVFGAADSGGNGVIIPASGGSYELIRPSTDSVYLNASSGSNSVIIIEGNVQ